MKQGAQSALLRLTKITTIFKVKELYLKRG